MNQKAIDPAYKAAEMYEEVLVKGVFNYWTPLLVERAAPRPGEKVLDLACGTGVVARAMVPIVGEQGKVTGLDKSSAMLSIACRQFSEHCEAIDWWEGVAEKMPFTDSLFDLLVCQQGLQFFLDRPGAAREMRRVLRPGGRAAIAVWQDIGQHPFYKTILEAVAEAMSVPFSAVAAIFAFGSASELAALLNSAGFTAVRVESVSREVHFSQPERFLELTFQAAAAVMPVYARLDAQTQSAAFAALKQEMLPLIAAYTRDGYLTFPMHANIALAMRG